MKIRVWAGVCLLVVAVPGRAQTPEGRSIYYTNLESATWSSPELFLQWTTTEREFRSGKPVGEPARNEYRMKLGKQPFMTAAGKTRYFEYPYEATLVSRNLQVMNAALLDQVASWIRKNPPAEPEQTEVSVEAVTWAASDHSVRWVTEERKIRDGKRGEPIRKEYRIQLRDSTMVHAGEARLVPPSQCEALSRNLRWVLEPYIGDAVKWWESSPFPSSRSAPVIFAQKQ